MKVALIERHLVGGSCVNTGCMPTNALVASAYAAHMARRAHDFGVVIDAPVGVDMRAVQARAHKVTLDARGNLEKWLGGMNGLTVIRGHARFESADTLRVGNAVLTAPRIFVNVGGRATVPDMPGIRTVPDEYGHRRARGIGTGPSSRSSPGAVHSWERIRWQLWWQLSDCLHTSGSKLIETRGAPNLLRDNDNPENTSSLRLFGIALDRAHNP